MDAVKSLLEVKVYVEWSLSFTTLLNNVPESEYMVNASFAFPKASLFVSEYSVNCWCNSMYHDFAENLAGNREKCDAPLVVTVGQNLNDRSLCPV